MNSPCPACGCIDPHGAGAHAIAAALAEDDLDRAIDAGLLCAIPCAGCGEACRARIVRARDTRIAALDARERYRARNARLQRRVDERAAARTGTASVPAAQAKPALPSAAAAVLARAKARAAERHKP